MQSISDISRGVHNGYEYSLHKRRIFENIKFTYVPDKNKTGAKKKLATFINDLKRSTTENSRLYLDMLVQMFDTEKSQRHENKSVYLSTQKRGEALQKYSEIW